MDKKVKFVKGISIFEGISNNYIQDIIFGASFLEYKRGEKVYVTGDTCDSVYLV